MKQHYTQQPPTKPGHYWAKHENGEAEIIKIEHDNNGNLGEYDDEGFIPLYPLPQYKSSLTASYPYIVLWGENPLQEPEQKQHHIDKICHHLNEHAPLTATIIFILCIIIILTIILLKTPPPH